MTGFLKKFMVYKLHNTKIYTCLPEDRIFPLSSILYERADSSSSFLQKSDDSEKDILALLTSGLKSKIYKKIEF